jgi:hypothetical protein
VALPVLGTRTVRRAPSAVVIIRVPGVEPTLGRGFRLDEDQAEGRDAVVVLGHDFWVSQYSASPSVLGSHVRLNGINRRMRKTARPVVWEGAWAQSHPTRSRSPGRATGHVFSRS